MFDGVYILRRNDKHFINITHALLDFYDEDMELADYCVKNVVILSPDDASHTCYKIDTMDMRQIFMSDGFHY